MPAAMRWAFIWLNKALFNESISTSCALSENPIKSTKSASKNLVV
jgi:hypothetical protein